MELCYNKIVRRLNSAHTRSRTLSHKLYFAMYCISTMLGERVRTNLLKIATMREHSSHSIWVVCVCVCARTRRIFLRMMYLLVAQFQYTLIVLFARRVAAVSMVLFTCLLFNVCVCVMRYKATYEM